MEKAGIRETTEEISKNQKEGTNLKVQHKADTKAYEQELQRDKELTPPFKTDTIKDGLTVFRFGNPNLTPLYFTFNTKETENIMNGHFIPMSKNPRESKNEYSKILITKFNKLLQDKRINKKSTTIDKPSTIYDDEFNDCIMSVMSDVTIETIISTLQGVNLNSPLPTQTPPPPPPPPSKNDLDVEAPQPNIMDKLQKSIIRFNQFIQMSLSTRTFTYIVNRAQYEAVVEAMWDKIYELNKSPSKTEDQLKLIGTLLSMLLSVIQTWKNKHTGEPMTLKIKRDEEGNKTAVDFLIPDGQWRPVTESITGLDKYSELISNIDCERTKQKYPNSPLLQRCSLFLKGLTNGGRKSRKLKSRKARRTRKSRRTKRRTRRAKK